VDGIWPQSNRARPALSVELDDETLSSLFDVNGSGGVHATECESAQLSGHERRRLLAISVKHFGRDSGMPIEVVVQLSSDGVAGKACPNRSSSIVLIQIQNARKIALDLENVVGITGHARQLTIRPASLRTERIQIPEHEHPMNLQLSSPFRLARSPSK
jgi:hypothetical protein